MSSSPTTRDQTPQPQSQPPSQQDAMALMNSQGNPSSQHQMSELHHNNHTPPASSSSCVDGTARNASANLNNNKNNNKNRNNAQTNLIAQSNSNNNVAPLLSDEDIVRQLSSRGFIATYRPFEWLVGVGVTLFGFLIGDKVIPYCRPFLWNDATIANEYKENAFPDYSLVVMCVLAAVVLTLIAALRPQSSTSTSTSSSFSPLVMAEINCVLLFFVHALMLNELITGCLKVFDGRLRPDFISRLHSLGYNSTNSATNVDFCELSKTESLIHKGRLSFPSGHSSTSFFCCTALSLYLLSRLRAYSANNNVSTSSSSAAASMSFPRSGVARLLIGSLPLLLSFFVASTRTRDNRHHHADILAGAIIGFFSAVSSWKLHYIHVDDAKLHMLLVLGDDNSNNNNNNNNNNNDTDHGSHVETSAVAVPTDSNNPSNTHSALPWFLRAENRSNVGDHVPRWFL